MDCLSAFLNQHIAVHLLSSEFLTPPPVLPKKEEEGKEVHKLNTVEHEKIGFIFTTLSLEYNEWET